MSTSSSNLVIAGAGLGGLMLAQAVTRRGMTCEILERDADAVSRDQGYRIHLDADATAALRECLPEALFDRFITLSEPLGQGFAFFDEQLRQLAYFTDGPPPGDERAGGRAIARTTLRRLLMTGLSARLHYSAALRGYQVDATGVTVERHDGVHLRGELLVGADGVGSAVARRLIPRQAPVDTGGVALIGRLRTTDEVLGCMPTGRFDRLGLVVGPAGVNLFLSQRLASHDDAALVAARPELAPYLDPTPNASVWALVARADRLAPGGALLDMRGEALAQVAARALAGWHPRMRRLLALTDASDLLCTPLRSADRLAAWPSDPRVTLLGDALHCMTPLEGQGASMAFNDVRDLSRLLARARPGAAGWADALAAHEATLVARATRAVRSSRRVYDQAVAEGWRRAAFKLGLRVGDGLGRLFGPTRS